jgi:anaerobic magnesium-protoporphyrin IX monomethyl ester cyclase
MKKKIALVNTPFIEVKDNHPLLPPLGLTYLAAVLEQDNHEIKIIDCPACNFDHEKLKNELTSFAPDIVGITSLTPTIDSAFHSARVAKEAAPNAQVLLGGPHATFLDKEVLSQESAIDIVVRGEGELTLQEIAQGASDASSLGKVAGITFRNTEGQFMQTPNRAFIPNLDELPRPAYKYLNLENYRLFGKLHMPIMASRGCLYQCSFCVSSRMWGGRYRTRTPKSVADELEWLKNDLGADGAQFHDDILTPEVKRIVEICDEIIARKINIPWGCQARVDQISKEVLVKLRKAGCNEVSYGIESGCQKILDAVKKKTSTEQNERAIKMAKEAGIFVAVTALIGYPGETKEDVQETLDLLRRAEPDDIWLCIATPYPGTELSVLLEKKGWKVSDNWALYDTMHSVFENPLLSGDDLKQIRKDFYNGFYGPKYVLRQTMKGYVRGNYFSQIMARTALNHILWRVRSSLS